jgi:hypothetical protein
MKILDMKYMPIHSKVVKLNAKIKKKIRSMFRIELPKEKHLKQSIKSNYKRY